MTGKFVWLKLLITISFFISFFSTAPAQPTANEQRISGWSSDIDTMLALIQREHYVYRSKPLPPELLTQASDLKTKISEFSDERMLLELQRLMFYMHDGHSYILPVARNVASMYMPLQFYIFNDGTFVIDADDPYKDLIGAKVISINGVKTEKLVDDMNTYIHHDNKFTVIWFAPSILRFRGTYEPYGLIAGSPDVTMQLIDKNKKTITRKISFIPAINFHGIPKLMPSLLAGNTTAPLYLSQVENNFWFTSINKKTLYFQFNQVEDKDTETLAVFAAKLDSALKIQKPGLFIIDVRNNNGGNLDLLPPIMNVIKSFEQQNAASKIIVITGRNTFSAAQVFIALINRDTHALFAGEPSSSSPNFVGEGNYITLPYSGAMGSISNKYHEQIPGDKRLWIEPDLPVTLSSVQYFKNEDPVLDFILKDVR
ncbi:MAG TPA: hypothetical protein VGI61_09600 [Parafilimonas sp.]